MTFTPSPRPMLGMFWMLITGLCFVGVTVLIKILGAGMPPAQTAFLRYLLGLVFLVPMLRPMLNSHLTLRHWGMFGARGVLHTIGAGMWFYAMTRIPLSELTAMNYLAPVYVTIGAALFLGEKLAARRIAAVVMALIGTAIILRPGFREISPGHWAMLVAAFATGASYLLAKVLVDEVSPAVVVSMLSIFVTIGLAPFAAMAWVTPSWAQIGILFCVACFATAGHYTMTLAFRAAPVTLTQPVTFLQLVWAVAIGALFFDEPVDIWVVIGGSVILAAISFITWREAVLNRRPITPPTPATKV